MLFWVHKVQLPVMKAWEGKEGAPAWLQWWDRCRN